MKNPIEEPILAKYIATLCLKGFRLHFAYFQRKTKKAKQYFEEANLKAHRKTCSERIYYYDKRVKETINLLKQSVPSLEPNAKFWAEVKSTYAELIQHHPQGELAETFYNSVFCNLFNYQYFNNDNIFIESSLPKNRAEEIQDTVYDSYFPRHSSIKKTIKKIINNLDFTLKFENIHRDANYIIKTFIKNTGINPHHVEHLRIDVLKSIFFRNKAAFVLGRVLMHDKQYPFLIPILNLKNSLSNKNSALYADTIINDQESILSTFGFYHSYFMVHTQVPAAVISFLQQLIPEKSKADLYTAIGFHKQGKNEFYRDFLNHLEKSSDNFERSKGAEGLVMAVIDLPSFPYVFKIIKDKFPAVKKISRQEVIDRYLLVKKHDRVGRMADTLEFSNVSLPKSRIPEKLLEKLRQDFGQSMTESQDAIVIHHLYIERRVTPLNIFLESASPAVIAKTMKEYSQAVKDMMVANIFPGDLLLKNFGVTTSDRIIFYDYDEVQYLTEINFRKIPQAQNYEQEMSSEPWYSVGLNDVFPEEFLTFITPDPLLKKYFKQQASELLDYQFWKKVQQEVINGVPHDIYSYPTTTRFSNTFKDFSP